MSKLKIPYYRVGTVKFSTLEAADRRALKLAVLHPKWLVVVTYHRGPGKPILLSATYFNGKKNSQHSTL